MPDFQSYGQFSLSQVVDFMNGRDGVAISANNISLKSLFAIAQQNSIELPNGDYTAPHGMKEFLGMRYSNLPAGSPILRLLDQDGIEITARQDEIILDVGDEVPPYIFGIGPNDITLNFEPPPPARPEWLGENVPIDEEGRIWAIQTVHANDRLASPNVDPFVYAAGAPIDLNVGHEAAVNYVILRNEELEGAGEDFAPHSFANPVAGYDVGIPSTYNFIATVHNQMSWSYRKHYPPEMTAFIVPPGWECTVYRMPGYNPVGSPSYVGYGSRYVVSGATVFYSDSTNASNYSQTNINFNMVSVSREGFNARGDMGYWDLNGGVYDRDFVPNGGYSYLFRKIPMPA